MRPTALQLPQRPNYSLHSKMRKHRNNPDIHFTNVDDHSTLQVLIGHLISTRGCQVDGVLGSCGWQTVAGSRGETLERSVVRMLHSATLHEGSTEQGNAPWAEVTEYLGQRSDWVEKDCRRDAKHLSVLLLTQKSKKISYFNHISCDEMQLCSIVSFCFRQLRRIWFSYL